MLNQLLKEEEAVNNSTRVKNVHTKRNRQRRRK